MKLQKYKRDSAVSYAMGATLVAELLKTGRHNITRAFLRPTEKHGADLEKILTELKLHNIEIIESTKAFNILGAKDNCLLIAEFEKAVDDMLIAPVDDYYPGEIILVNPSDAGNLGTIMRSAAAFGYENLTIVAPAIDPYDPKTIRASMGAVFHLNIRVVNGIDELMSDDSLEGCLAFVLDDGARALSSFNPKDNWGLVSLVKPTLIFGNEATGLPKGFCEKAGATPVFISQSTKVDSLNLGVAASIAMHYFSALS